MLKWYKSGVVYQIYPASFCDKNGDGVGDIKGIISKIPYLKNLGVDIVWLSPIYPSPMVDNGYDISDYLDINPLYGTMNEFKEMLDEFHKNGIKLLMDLVVNHTSNEHYWFKEAIKSIDNPYHDYYFFQDKPNNWTSFFEGSAWEYVKGINQYYLHIFAKKQPDLNWDNVKVRNEVKKILKYWLDLGVDGFRCDVLNIISKVKGLPNGRMSDFAVGIEHYANGPHLHEYLHELYVDVFSHYDCMIIGECGGQSIEEATKLTSEKREELHMIFQFNHFGLDCGAYKWDIKPFKFHQIKECMLPWQKDFNEGWPTLVLENHDQPRSINRYGDLNYHDKSAMFTATFMFLQRGTPFIYQGEELGMTNYPFESINDFKDIESINIYHKGHDEMGLSDEEMIKRLRYISRDNARTPMQWDNTLNAGFTSGKPWLKVNPNYLEINAEEEVNNPESIYNYYRKLISLRKNYPTLIDGDFEDLALERDDIVMYKREKEDVFYIIGNNTANNKSILFENLNKYELLLSNYKNNNDDEFYLPYEIRVYRLIK